MEAGTSHREHGEEHADGGMKSMLTDGGEKKTDRIKFKFRMVDDSKRSDTLGTRRTSRWI